MSTPDSTTIPEATQAAAPPDSSSTHPTAAEHYGPLTSETLAAALQAHDGSDVLCVAPNLEETGTALIGAAGGLLDLRLSVETQDATDVWYVDTLATVQARRAAQNAPALAVDPQTAPTDGGETAQPAATEDPLVSPVDITPAAASTTPTAPVDSAGQPLTEVSPGEKAAAAGTLPAESPAAQPGLTARPAGVGVDGAVYRGRDDNDAVTDRFCRVVSGEYAGRYGVYLSTASLGADGWPETIVVRTRDAEDENLVVDYSDCRPDTPGKR